MPNWCEGTLKVRGEKEDIVRFLKEGIEPIGYLNDTEPVVIDEEEYCIVLKTKKGGFYIKGTHRSFIEQCEIEYYYDNGILALEFKQAWGIDAVVLANISKEFNVDFKIYAYERGMEFNQDIEIHKGDIIKNQEIQFSDYAWECTNPNIGG